MSTAFVYLVIWQVYNMKWCVRLQHRVLQTVKKLYRRSFGKYKLYHMIPVEWKVFQQTYNFDRCNDTIFFSVFDFYTNKILASNKINFTLLWKKYFFYFSTTRWGRKCAVPQSAKGGPTEALDGSPGEARILGLSWIEGHPLRHIGEKVQRHRA